MAEETIMKALQQTETFSDTIWERPLVSSNIGLFIIILLSLLFLLLLLFIVIIVIVVIIVVVVVVVVIVVDVILFNFCIYLE